MEETVTVNIDNLIGTLNVTGSLSDEDIAKIKQRVQSALLECISDVKPKVETRTITERTVLVGEGQLPVTLKTKGNDPNCQLFIGGYTYEFDKETLTQLYNAIGELSKA